MPTLPIASQEQQAQIHAIIKELVSEVSKDVNNVSYHGLLSGLAGHLLFLFNAHKLDESLVDEGLFVEKLDYLQEHLGEQSFELSNGLAGQAWVLEYFNQADTDDYEPELLNELDDLFNEALNHQPWPGEIETVLGLGGYTPYAALRHRKVDQTALFTTIVNDFQSVAVKVSDDQLAWSQPKNSVYRFDKEDLEQQEYNLGLAHGVPGAIAALLPALKVTSLKSQVTELLTKSCDWLLNQQNPNKEEECCYGSCAGEAHLSRLGWCYGDLTIALTLARVGHALDRPSYIEKAQTIALKAAKRDAKSGAINDAGLCHGFVGLVVIFALLNKHMPHPELEQATQYWLEYSLKQYQEKGVAAFNSFNGETRQHDVNHGFLMGYAGVGVGFISVLNDDFDWAECLLMA